MDPDPDDLMPASGTEAAISDKTGTIQQQTDTSSIADVREEVTTSVDRGAAVTSKTQMNREVVEAFYAAKLYLPGIFTHKLFLILQSFLPLLDLGTDCMNAGMDRYL